MIRFEPQIRFEPMQAADVQWIGMQPDQMGALGLWAPEMTVGYGQSLIDAGPCWAGFAGDEIIGAAGFAMVFPTMATAWALLTDRIGDHRFAMVRFVRARLAEQPFARIEALTRAHKPEQARFARACGFERAAVLRCHGPVCETTELWEVVRAGT